MNTTAETVVYLFDLLPSGISQAAHESMFLDSDERVSAWARLPTLGSWAAATIMGVGVAGAAARAGSSRSREA